jgi:hypothetical protein
MISFFQEMSDRNFPLFCFGLACLVAALLCMLAATRSQVQVAGVNAWLKPIKFFLSSAIFAHTMAWLLVYLQAPGKVAIYSWVVIIVLAFETIYITLQAARGQLSHFNVSSAFHGFMYSMMGMAIFTMTIWTAYISYLFFCTDLPLFPLPYLWGIRLGIALFVIFALEGGVMASRLSHTVGAPDGTPGLPVTKWSKTHGDLRVAHFLGMHALQVLPLLSYYVFDSVAAVITTGVIYFVVTSGLFIRAMQSRPLWRS